MISAPIVSTIEASFTGFDNATLNGSLDSPGTAGTVEVYFEYGTTTGYGGVTPHLSLSSADNFSFTISGLTPSTFYYFRARADGGIHGSAFGDNLTFTTLIVAAPLVSTIEASSISYDNATLNGLLDSPGTAGTVEVYFEYGTSLAFGKTTVPQSLTTAGNFNLKISGLAAATTYYFRARAEGGIHGTAYGDNLTLTTLTATAPEVITFVATDISGDSVTLNGRLNSPGTAETVKVSFGYGIANSYDNSTAALPMTAADNFSITVNGLTPATTYHFQARADGGIHGAAFGLDLTFTTLTPPSVSTSPATNIRLNSATLNGRLLDIGTASSDNLSFRYAPDSYFSSHNNSYIDETPVQTMSAPGIFSADISGLQPGTLYHFAAVAEGAGRVQGMDSTFTTSTMSPVVVTLPATGITRNTATINAKLVEIGTAVAVAVSFDYGITAGYGNTFSVGTIASPGTFSHELTNLSPGTTYHFRAFFNDGIQDVYGVDMTFTTASIPIVVETAPASIITAGTANLNGVLSSFGTAAIINVSFEYGTSASYGETTPAQALIITGTFQVSLSGLSPGKTYHFRARADDGMGQVVYGTDMSFSTLTSPPLVVTEPSTAINFTTVVLNGLLESMGTADSVNVFFEYGTTADYGSSTTIQSLTAAGEFFGQIKQSESGGYLSFPDQSRRRNTWHGLRS